MDTLLLGITVVSLIVALVMSVTAWRLMRDDKQRSAARIAALSAAASDDVIEEPFPEIPVGARANESSLGSGAGGRLRLDESARPADSISLRMAP